MLNLAHEPDRRGPGGPMAAHCISPETTLKVLFSTPVYDSIRRIFLCLSVSKLEGVVVESSKNVVYRSCTLKGQIVLSDILLATYKTFPLEQNIFGLV
jgi:hypothetical protein